MERNGKKTKTLGLLYGNLSLGGIQRGASFQIPMFKAMGYRIVVLSVQPPADCEYVIPEIDVRVCIGADSAETRSKNVETAAREHGLDLIVHHAAYDAAMLSADIEGARRAGVPVVIFWHNVFSHFYLRKFRQLEAKELFAACRAATAMITLTKTDEAFFRMMRALMSMRSLLACTPQFMPEALFTTMPPTMAEPMEAGSGGNTRP